MVSALNYLFYDDSPVFGGHEVMTLLGVEALLAEPDVRVHFLASTSNAALIGKLEALSARYGGLHLHPISQRSSKLEALRNRLKPSRIRELAEQLRPFAPDLVIAVQGNIEHSSLALLAAAQAGLKAVSYIPVPHSNAEMGAKLGALRDLFTAPLFRTPSAFITITDEMGAMLRQRGATCPIRIVYNGVDTTRYQPRPKDAARAALGLPDGRRLIGTVGRLEFRQKQQHLLVDAVKSSPTLAAACHLVFAGDGPDAGNLRDRVKEAGLEANVTILPWSDTAGLYPALDALVIPSRYEGLPLVMLEALACGTAVLGSNRDGMKDVLPEAWRFQPDSVNALAATLDRFLKEGAPPPPSDLVTRVRTTMSLTAFSDGFRSALRELAGGD